MPMRLSPAAFAALLFVPAVLASQSNGPPAIDTTGRSVSGAFSAGQVARGEEVFRSYCASCHAPTFHTGEDFRRAWLGRTVYDYFMVVRTTMPEDNPAGLTDDEYTRVVAYILSLNGFPAGTDSLPSDTLVMRRLRITPAPAAATPNPPPPPPRSAKPGRR